MIDKRKKNIIYTILITIFLFFNINLLTVGAVEEDVIIDNEEIEIQLEELYNYINNMKTDVELLNELNPIEYIEAYINTGEGNLSLSEIGSAVVSLIFKEVQAVLALAFSIIVIGIISALLKNLQETFNSDGISEIAFYACYAVLIVLLSRSFLISLDLAQDAITNMVNFMSILLPILTIMLAAAGGFTQAASMDPVVLGSTIFVPQIYQNVIIPLILMWFVLQFANNMTNGSKISNLCGMVKKTTLWTQGIVITIFIGILTVRGISSSTIDAVTLKTTKFAVDNFIPIVGKSFSDAISSVAGYSLIIKNSIGVLGLIVIILLIMYPIIKIVLSSLIFKLSASLLEPITDKRITSSISAVSEALTLMMGCVLTVSLMFFVLIATMADAGKFVIGG